MTRMGITAALLAALAAPVGAQGTGRAFSGGHVCQLFDGATLVSGSSDCLLVFYMEADPIGMIAEFEDNAISVRGDFFEDDRVTVDGAPATRAVHPALDCFIVDGTARALCVGSK